MTPIQIGNIDLDSAILLAPMENVTDLPFRVLCRRLGADLVYTEFINVEGLVRNSEKTHQKMRYLPEERPLGIQLYGGTTQSISLAARIAEENQPDLIDINCGCWVKDVALRGDGAGLLRDLPRMKSIVKSVIDSVSLPVTVKTRLGWDQENINILEVAAMLEDIGVAALTIHCRTRAQGHKGNPDYSWVRKVKDLVKMPVIVNGNITSPHIADEVFSSTGGDGVMIGRGAIDNPWIFRQIKKYLKDRTLEPLPSIEERFRVMMEHLNLSIEYKGEVKGILEFRKHYAGYLKGMRNASKVRQRLMDFNAIEPVQEIIQEYYEELTTEQIVFHSNEQ